MQTFGKWKVEKQGPAENVFVAVHSETRQRGMVKIATPGKPVESQVEALSRLDHPNIIKLLDYDLQHDPQYIVTEYHPAGEVRWHHHAWSRDRRTKMCVDVYRAGLYALENNSIWRDTHGSNVVVDQDGNPVLIDLDYTRQECEAAGREALAGFINHFIGTEMFLHYFENEIIPMNNKTS